MKFVLVNGTQFKMTFNFFKPLSKTFFTNKDLNDKLLMMEDHNKKWSTQDILAPSRKHKEFTMMMEVMRYSSTSQLKAINSQTLLAFSVNVMRLYSKFNKAQLPEKQLAQKYNSAMECFSKLVKIFSKEASDNVLNFVIKNVIHGDKIWLTRRVCVDVLITINNAGYEASVICNELLNNIELSENYDADAVKPVIKVLYELLDIYTWPETSDTVEFLYRLLRIYYSSLHDQSKDIKEQYFKNLRGSLELCIRNIIHHLASNQLLIVIQQMSIWSINADVSQNVIVNYGSTLEYAAYIHQANSLVNTLTSDLLSLIMQMIGSKMRFISVLGNRVFQYLIDRGQNIMLFNTPKIFFESMHLVSKLGKYSKADKNFLKEHREIIYDSLTKSFLNHGLYRLNVETTYCTVCLLAIELPCGFTAAFLCCLMMNLQETVRKHQETLGKDVCNHMHATIISVLTFVCWLHNAKDLYQYVNHILMKRAQWAPHLNPPLQSNYDNFAVHHVIWDKPELYPVDWEVRYGLWKCFRLNKSVTIQLKSTDEIAHKTERVINKRKFNLKDQIVVYKTKNELIKYKCRKVGLILINKSIPLYLAILQVFK